MKKKISGIIMASFSPQNFYFLFSVGQQQFGNRWGLPDSPGTSISSDAVTVLVTVYYTLQNKHKRNTHTQ